MELFDFANNPYFGAGAGLLGITTVLAVLRRGLGQATNLAQRRLLTKLEIPSKDKSYGWFLNWMELKQKDLKAWNPTLSVQTNYIKHDNGSVSAKFNMVPGQGRHFFKYKGAWMMMERTRAEKMVDLTNAAPWETITITTLSRDKKLFHELLEEAKSLETSREAGKTVIYTSFGHEWRPFGQPRQRRALDSVILDQGVGERLLEDVKTFLTNGSWYSDRGIPYRRGYLLYGVPGSGKSSFIQALAGALEYNICVLSLGEVTLTDDRLNHLLVHAPPRSLLLLEDVDAAFLKREVKQGYQAGVTFSGLLNALDGVTSAEERLIFMTTNHIDQLDPALIRPGRVDFRQEFGWATPYQMEKMFLRFYPGKEEECRQFLQQLQHARVSTAQLQGLFLFWRDDPKAAVLHARSLTAGSNWAKKETVDQLAASASR